MKPQKTRDVLALMRAQGWTLLRSGKGSHQLWRSADELTQVMVPAGHREISSGVLKQLAQAGINIPSNWI